MYMYIPCQKNHESCPCPDLDLYQGGRSVGKCVFQVGFVGVLQKSWLNVFSVKFQTCSTPTYPDSWEMIQVRPTNLGMGWNYHWISFPMPVWWNHGTNKQQATRVWTHDNNNRIQCGDPCFIQVCSEGHSMLDAVGSGCNQTTWQVEMGSTGWMANLNTELTWYMIFSHIFIYIYVRIFHSDIYIYVYI